MVHEIFDVYAVVENGTILHKYFLYLLRYYFLSIIVLMDEIGKVDIIIHKVSILNNSPHPTITTYMDPEANRTRFLNNPVQYALHLPHKFGSAASEFLFCILEFEYLFRL